MLSPRTAGLLMLLALYNSACTDLPIIESGVCGNGVIEGNETCDTFAPNPGGVCRPQGSVGECRLDCRRTSSGTRALCPDGWGCDHDGLCRAPTGDFDDIKLPLGGVESLAAGDFDHDGRADLVSREPADSAMRGKPSVHYFDENGALSETRTFPRRVGVPYIGDVSGDGHADLVFTNYAIGVLLGRADRSWVPQTFSSYRLPNAHVRIVGVTDRELVSGDSAVAALTSIGNKTGIFIPNHAGTLLLSASLPAPVETLAGNPVTGHIVEGTTSPCRELVLAYRDADQLSLFDVCDMDDSVGLPTWKPNISEQRVSFDPPARIDHGPLIADLNGDGHLDVLVGASQRVYAAYGDGRGLSTAVPFLLHNTHEDLIPAEIPMPLAVGELTGDHIPDFVFPRFILASAPGSGVGGVPAYAVPQVNEGAAWTEALIADLNGNSMPDALAVSNAGLNLVFFNGSNSIFMSTADVPTVGPVQHLALGDFDGDLLNDVAFIERAASVEDSDSLRIAFGSPAGRPSAPVTVAHVNAAEQVAGFADIGVSSLLVASGTTRDGTFTGELTALDGSSDRLPLALHALVSLGDNGSVARAASLAISVGAFTQPGHHDLVTLASKDVRVGFEYWLIPSIDDSGSLPMRLAGEFDPRLFPLASDHEGESRLALAGTSGDLDGDGLDESIWLMPADSNSACALIWFDVDATKRRIVPRGELILNVPCDAPALAVVDGDVDGHPDVAVLTGDARERATISVLWNDGRGAFDATRMTALSRPDQVPRAFSWLSASPGASGASVAFVTQNTLELVRGAQREFDAPRSLRQLERGTGVCAADFNGDGVDDLAVADAGKMRLLNAQLVPP